MNLKKSELLKNMKSITSGLAPGTYNPLDKVALDHLKGNSHKYGCTEGSEDPEGSEGTESSEE